MVAAFVLWGVGNFTLRKSGGRSASWPVCIGVGLAMVIFAGGILNCAHIARGPVLWTLAGVATIISILEATQKRFAPIQGMAARFELVITGLVIAGVTGFAIHTQLPPKAFNCDDDFQRYFPQPVSMLATGTVLGSPLGGLGSTTLGGEAFLHGFVLSVLPIGYLNGVDAVFGLMVLMLICASAGWRRYASFPGAVLGPVVVATINPEYVNVSSLYLGSVLMATAVMLVVDEKEESGPPALVLGLVYASLVALKTTFIFFPILHLPIAALAVKPETGSWKRVFRWASWVVLSAFLCVAPWFATHVPNYIAPGIFGNIPTPTADEGVLDLLSTNEFFYWDCFLKYSVVIGFAAAVSLIAAVSWYAEPDWRKRREAIGVLAAGGACVMGYFLFICVLGPVWFGYLTGLRYYIPMLLGCGLPAFVLLQRLSLRVPPGIPPALPVVICAITFSLFADSAVARYHQAVRWGSMLGFHAFAESDRYLGYCEFCLSDGTAQRVRELQAKVPSGEPILTVISTPFLMDFRRNRIIDVEPGGLLTPWAHVPEGVRYVFWQYHGFKGFGDLGVSTETAFLQLIDGPGRQDRTIGVRGLAFHRRLDELLKGSKIISDDGEFIVFKLEGPYK